MIRGAVDSRHEAVLSLRVRGPSGSELDVDAVIDTGFTGALTLPPDVISALNLPFRVQIDTRLADGTPRQLDTFDAEVEWDGAWLPVVVWEVDASPVLGLALLARHEVFIELMPGGVVDITRLP